MKRRKRRSFEPQDAWEHMWCELEGKSLKHLSEWERAFVRSMAVRPKRLSSKQAAICKRIADSAKAFPSQARTPRHHGERQRATSAPNRSAHSAKPSTSR